VTLALQRNSIESYWTRSETYDSLKFYIDMDFDGLKEAIVQMLGTAPLFYNDEQALRSVIRFAYISCVDEFLRIEELPTGIGYADVVYLPKKGSSMPIMIVELKVNKSTDGAIAQIKNKNYPQALEGFGSDILLVGISYDVKSKEHSCVIEKHVKGVNDGRYF
jgi:hypothetical protein